MLTFEALRQRNNWHDVIAALRHAGVAQPQQRAEAIQRLANEWRLVVQQRSQAAQLRRLQDLDRPLVNALYSSRERAFEAAFESLLNRTEIKFVKFDDGGRPGAFDYLLTIEERDELVVECKTRQGASLVDLNSARVVLASSEQFGYGNSPCVTICQPGVDPNVPPTLQSCARLALVETHDLAEAFVQLIEGTLTKQELHDWLAQPGQANTGTLYSTRSMRRQV
jgi:helicase